MKNLSEFLGIIPHIKDVLKYRNRPQLETTDIRCGLVDEYLVVAFKVHNKGKSDVLSFSVRGIIYDKNGDPISDPHRESCNEIARGKLSKEIRFPFRNYCEKFVTLVIIITIGETQFRKEVDIKECLKQNYKIKFDSLSISFGKRPK